MHSTVLKPSPEETWMMLYVGCVELLEKFIMVMATQKTAVLLRGPVEI